MASTLVNHFVFRFNILLKDYIVHSVNVARVKWFTRHIFHSQTILIKGTSINSAHGVTGDLGTCGCAVFLVIHLKSPPLRRLVSYLIINMASFVVRCSQLQQVASVCYRIYVVVGISCFNKNILCEFRTMLHFCQFILSQYYICIMVINFGVSDQFFFKFFTSVSDRVPHTTYIIHDYYLL